MIPDVTPAAGDLYDRIGLTYSGQRRTDPWISAHIWSALGDARTVLNVGAGTGSYEPPDRMVTAVEPSAVMRAQRPPGAAPCIAASAQALPFGDGSFDAAMAILSDHHWDDPIAGLRELRRVPHGSSSSSGTTRARATSGWCATICRSFSPPSPHGPH